MTALTKREHELLNEMHTIIRMKKQVDRWQALNALSIKWNEGEE